MLDGSFRLFAEMSFDTFFDPLISICPCLLLLPLKTTVCPFNLSIQIVVKARRVRSTGDEDKHVCGLTDERIDFSRFLCPVREQESTGHREATVELHPHKFGGSVVAARAYCGERDGVMAFLPTWVVDLVQVNSPIIIGSDDQGCVL